MATSPQPRPRRSRWLWLGVIVALVGAAAAGRWLTRPPASDDERRLVGTWRVESATYPPEMIVRFDLRPDGAMRMRAAEARTGAALADQPDWGHWQVADGRFIVTRQPDGGGSRAWEYVLAWDGPDRFTLAEPEPGERASTWTRIGPAGPGP